MLAQAGAGQTLRLPEKAKRPSAEQPTYAAKLIKELEGEIASLRATPAEGSVHQDVIRASINCRQLAADLLALGDREQSNGSIAFHVGHVLTLGLPDIDGVFTELVSGQPTALACSDAQSSLRRFNSSVDAILRGGMTPGDVPGPQLESAFAHLASCIAAIEGAPTQSHWVLESAGEEHDEAAPAEHALEELQARLAQAEIAPEVQAELSYIAEQLRRASEFDEFRPRVLQIHAALERLLGFAQAVQNAKWLKKEVRESLEAQLGRVASMLREPPTRQEAIAASANLATTAMILNRASQIVDSEPRVPLLVGGWLEQPDRVREDSLKLLAAVLKRMAQYRQSDSPNLRRELRLVERDLDQAYREAESSLLDRMIAEKQPSLADPSFSTLVADHQQTLEDIHRVRQLPIWTQAIQGIDAQIAERFEKQATRIAKLLVDNTRRPDAIAAMDQFESQWSSFHRLAIEDALESPTPAVLEVTGGLHLELAAVIKATRREWARAWAEGETAGSAAKRMALLAQLGAAITSHASAQDQGQNVEMLNRWAAWQLDPDLPGRTSAEFSGRLKLATAAAAANDDAGLERQLQQLEQEAPVARLVMRLMSLMGERLGELPSGALGCAGKLQHAAPANAVLVEHRVMIAELCRALHEHQHAIEAGSNRASEWNQYVESLSDALLESLAPSRPFVSPISGLDVEN